AAPADPATPATGPAAAPNGSACACTTGTSAHASAQLSPAAKIRRAHQEKPAAFAFIRTPLNPPQAPLP
ncbi:MAG: hypothetical protein RSE06_15085, partial [Comamonas sp.]